MAGASDKPLHHGHRERLRERAAAGLDSFADHEVLELLLFSVIPRANTNPIAHRLLARFGSLSAVLEADPRDLATVEGMGARAASFLTLMPPLTRRYLHDRVVTDRPRLEGPVSVSEYLVPLLAGRAEEVAYLLCLDASLGVRYPALLGSGSVASTAVTPRQVVEVALRHRAVSVILAHNHPSGSLAPSGADRAMTCRIYAALAAVDIPLLDHVIVAGEKTYSFERSGIWPPEMEPPPAEWQA